MTRLSEVRLGRPIVAGFFERRTSSVQYVVADPETKHCAIIDPVLDFDPNSGATATHSADALLEHIESEKYRLQWILDTHPHADHFSAAGYLKDKTGISTAIGEKVTEVRSSGKASTTILTDFRQTARSGTSSSPMGSDSRSAIWRSRFC